MGKTSFEKLTMAACPAGSVAGASVGSAVLVETGVNIRVWVGRITAATGCEVGADVCVACAPQADESPTMKKAMTNLT